MSVMGVKNVNFGLNLHSTHILLSRLILIKNQQAIF